MLTIRRAMPEDAPAIHRVDAAAFSNPWTEDALAEDLKNVKFARYYLGEEKGAVVAFAGVWCVAGEGQITNIGVMPERQGQGYGEKIVRHLLEACWQEQIETVFLEVRQSNEPARRLYKKIGFTDAGRRKNFYTNPTEDAVIMACVSPSAQKGNL